jgi:hypothetical protein
MSLLQPRANHGQSRPPPPGTFRKPTSIFKKLVPRRSEHKTSMESYTFASTTAMSSLSSSRSTSTYFHLPRRVGTSPSSSNLMQWLQSDCPQDLLPRILAFAGPQVIATMSQTNRFWQDLVSQENTWQTLCTELYKVCMKICGCMKDYECKIAFCSHLIFVRFSGRTEMRYPPPGEITTSTILVFQSIFQQFPELYPVLKAQDCTSAIPSVSFFDLEGTFCVNRFRFKQNTMLTLPWKPWKFQIPFIQ